MALAAPALEDAAVTRILVRAPNWIGDVVLSLGAVRDLRRNFPDARIVVLARDSVRELYRAVPEVDATLAAGDFAATVESLGSFDAALLLTNSLRSALEVFAARIPERWGYATEGRGPLLTRAAAVPSDVRGKSEVYYYRAMLAGVGMTVSAEPDTSLACPEEWRARGRALLGDARARWVGLNPGAAFGKAKRWLPERYAAVAERLGRRAGARVAILGTATERPLAERIAALLPTPPRVLCGETDLSGLAGVLSELKLLITNDSGPMHLGSALGTPTLAIFGPTDWRETAPRGARSAIVREPVACSPCKLRECPIDHRCMREVTVERVSTAAQELFA